MSSPAAVAAAARADERREAMSAAAAAAAASASASASAAAQRHQSVASPVPRSIVSRVTAGALLTHATGQSDNFEAIPAVVVPEWSSDCVAACDGQREWAHRPLSPTPSDLSTVQSISSVEFTMGGVPAPLQALLEEQEHFTDLGEEPPKAFELDLSGCSSLTDVLVAEVICERFVTLRRLLLAQCLRLTEPAFLAIAYRCVPSPFGHPSATLWPPLGHALGLALGLGRTKERLRSSWVTYS